MQTFIQNVCLNGILVQVILIYFSLSVKQTFLLVNHVHIRSWNQPVLSNKG